MLVFQRSDLVKAFRAAPFASEADVAAFASKAGGCPPAEVAKLLPVVLELAPKSPREHRFRSAAFAAVARASAGPELFTPLVRGLKQADDILRPLLVELLPAVNDVAAHGEVCDLLASPDASLRAAGAEVLKQVGGRTALEVLTKRSLDPAFPGRLDAMNALLARAGQHGLPLLVAILRAGRPREKIHALRYLAEKSRFRDLGPVAQTAAMALLDTDDLVVAQAITTLGALDPADFWETCEPRIEGRGIEVVKAFLTQAAKRPGIEAAGFMRERFREGPKVLRLAILEVVEACAADAFLPLLIEALSHRDVSIRSRAAHALTELSRTGRIDAARAIVWLLRSRDVNVRRLAAEIATQVGDLGGSLAPRLLQSLRDEDWWVRERVLDALVEMNATAITKHLVKDYLADSSSVVRRFAVSALVRIKDPRALGALVRTAQQDEDWLVAELAVQAIGKMNDSRATAYLVDLLQSRPELRLVTIEALSRLKAADAAPDIAEMVHDEYADVRAAAIDFLAEHDDGTHALWVKGCEADPSALVRQAAGRLLARFDLQSAEAPTSPTDPRALEAILRQALAHKADDLFLFAGRAPSMKNMGRVVPLGETAFTPYMIKTMLEPHLTEAQRKALADRQEVDFSYELPGDHLRFRVNVFEQLHGLSAVFRAVKNQALSFSELGVPEEVAKFAELTSGLVLVGGPTGAGKSTTLAALIDHVNRTSSRHIVTIEDPIEVVHRRKKSLINQRELGPHTKSFGAALRSALRQDPDVILVGELRDLDTIAFAVSAAETGHLVLGTVHTTSADATVDRLINAFPPRQQGQIRGMLAESLRAVTCQYLLRTPEGKRRPAVEIMIANEAISTLIRKGKAFQIPTIMATSREGGMRLMDVDLIRLAKAGLVEVDEAYAKAVDKRAFEAALGLESPDAPAQTAPAAAGPPSRSVQPPASAGRPSHLPKLPGSA